MEVQWYPGHMTKARRMMEENIRLVDLVIELVDARIPLSSRNPDIDALCAGKGRIVLLCKADLADPAATEAFEAYFREKGILAVAVDAREKRAGDLVRRHVQEACREKLARDRARGIVGRPLRAMVAGIPNVGKSTFINSFAGRASTKTGNKPGVTRGKQWIRLGGSLELLDTPGILWPKFDDRRIGMRLALVGAIRDEILDKEELALWLLDYLEDAYPGIVEEKYLRGAGQPEQEPQTGDRKADGTEKTGVEMREERKEERKEESLFVPPAFLLLERIAAARRLLKKGGGPDTARAAALLLDDCKNGRIGRISLEQPGQEPVPSATLEEAAEASGSACAKPAKGEGGSAAGSVSRKAAASAAGQAPAGRNGGADRKYAGRRASGSREKPDGKKPDRKKTGNKAGGSKQSVKKTFGGKASGSKVSGRRGPAGPSSDRNSSKPGSGRWKKK